MFRKALLTTAAAIAMFALSSAARADTVTLIGINGTGVTATVTNYSLVGNTFTFTINNTSTLPGTTGTITNIGFSLPGTHSGTYTFTSTSSNYSLVYDLKATSGAQTVVSSPFNIVLTDKQNGNVTFGGGSVNNGIAPGSSVNFTITGDFSGLTANQIAQGIFARFQNVNPGGSDVACATGICSPATVPEPMTMILFGTGLAGVAAKVRRRRNAKA
jgi:hypothetical protein